MIIGGSKKEVIKNIKQNILDNELNKKVEVNDPKLSEEELNKVLNKFYGLRKNKIIYFLESRFAFLYVGKVAKKLDKSIKIEGIENIDDNNFIVGVQFHPEILPQFNNLFKEFIRNCLK